MTIAHPEGLKPRKTPRQARSEVTVEAIFEATIQVLLTEGLRRLTTTRVAERAGVSVGTMYQYFPHKQALLYAVLRRHLDAVAKAVETAGGRYRGQPIATIANGLVAAFIDAKAARADVSRALYLVAAGLDTSELLDGMSRRIHDATATLLESAADAEFDELPLVTFTLLSAMFGTVRMIFERGATPATWRGLRAHLPAMCRAYLREPAPETRPAPTPPVPPSRKTTRPGK